ncbi:MAG: head decoration protein [Candidatus Sedimenticola sp. (ex Thyasira tokunagai)]
MTNFTEGQHPGEFIVSVANGKRSFDDTTVLSGETLKAGHVVGKAYLGAGSSVADVGNTGDGAMGAITVGGNAQVGDYVLTVTEAATNAGAFQVVDPQGDVVGVGTVGQAFSGGGLSFTLADGAADFAVGDFFTLTVAAGSDKYREWNPANTDGSQVAAGILFDAVDASAADADGVRISRDAEVNEDELVYFTGATADDKAAAQVDLDSRGIIYR